MTLSTLPLMRYLSILLTASSASYSELNSTYANPFAFPRSSLISLTSVI